MSKRTRQGRRGAQAAADIWRCPACGTVNGLKAGTYRGPYGHFCSITDRYGIEHGYEGWALCYDCWVSEWMLQMVGWDVTDRILALTYMGATQADIGARLGISPRTVRRRLVKMRADPYIFRDVRDLVSALGGSTDRQ